MALPGALPARGLRIEAIVIRVDRKTSVLKTKLTPKQVRENRIVQFDP